MVYIQCPVKYGIDNIPVCHKRIVTERSDGLSRNIHNFSNVPILKNHLE